MTTDNPFGDLDGILIDRASVKLSGTGNITRRLIPDEPIAVIVYGHAGLPAITRNADDELVRTHPIKATYITELTPELLGRLAGKRKTHTIIDAIRDAYDITEGVARLPMDDDAEDAPELEEEATVTDLPAEDPAE
jgi:hypothetical protein